MAINKTKNIIEALLIVSDAGLKKEDILSAVADADAKDVVEAIGLLKQEYASSERAFDIDEIAGRYRIVTKPEYIPWINKLYERDINRLSKQSMETLALVAYKQPATRAEIESVRGVNTDGVLRSLLEKDLIKIKGRKDVPGRPLVYGTTGKFLETFGLNSLDDLPMLRDFREEELEFKQEEAKILPLEENDPALANKTEELKRQEEPVASSEEISEENNEEVNDIAPEDKVEEIKDQEETLAPSEEVPEDNNGGKNEA